MRLYRFALSGHCHRVELFLSLLKLPVELVNVDLRAGEHKQPEFLALNRLGQVPVLEDDGVVLADSNAILVYLALKHGPNWYPQDPLSAGRIQRLLSLAAGSLTQGPALARAHKLFGRPADLSAAHATATQLLNLLNGQLAKQEFLASNQPTIADLAHYAYIERAPEGGISLEPYAAVNAWLRRIEALPNFVAMPRAS